MVKLGALALASAGAGSRRNEDKPRNSMTKRFFRTRLLGGTGPIVAACLLAVLTLTPGPCAFGQTFPPYVVTVHNNFGPREFYNATPKSSQIWLYTNFQCDILTTNGWQSWNPVAGTYSTPIQLSTISQGKIRIYRNTAGTRLYAILSDTQPSTLPPGTAGATPYTYIEWSFGDTPTDPAYPHDPGTLDLSWIDRWDFLSRLVVSNLPSSPSTMVYGSKKRQSTAAVGAAMAGYSDSQPQYAWLKNSKVPLSFPGAANAFGWVTGNSTLTTGASQIGSLTQALDQVIAMAANSGVTWTTDTPTATGKNWTTAGFRVGTPEVMGNPAGDSTNAQNGWAAYCNFTKVDGQYTMTLSGFTLYTTPPLTPSAQKVWSAHDNAADAVYTLTQAQGLLDCIWISSFNNVSGTPPQWITNINNSAVGNSANIMYAIYNALASGVIYQDSFVSNTLLPPWPGYEARIEGVNTYDFEILTAGAPVTGGLAGYLNGQDLINLLNSQGNQMVNPYFLVLLSTQEVTPAYLYPSQDTWQSIGVVGPPPVLGLQNGPLNGSTAFGDNATLDWYIGGFGKPGITGALMLLLQN